MVFRNGEYFIKFGMADGAHMHGHHSCVLGKLHIRQAVANHDGVTEINIREVMLSLPGHANLGFPAAAVFARQVRTTVDGIHRGALREKAHLQIAVYGIHLRLRADLLGYALLVRHQNNMLESGTKQLHRLQKMVYKHKLINGFHIAAHNLHIHHTISIQKQGIHL